MNNQNDVETSSQVGSDEAAEIDLESLFTIKEARHPIESVRPNFQEAFSVIITESDFRAFFDKYVDMIFHHNRWGYPRDSLVHDAVLDFYGSSIRQITKLQPESIGMSQESFEIRKGTWNLFCRSLYSEIITARIVYGEREITTVESKLL